jgi:biopolymer transport protein ExbB
MEGYSIVGFFQKGGLFMYPILLVFLAGLAITVERWVQLNRTRSVNRKMWNELHPVLAKGDFEKAKSIISKDDSTISQMLGMGLARTGVVRRREDIEIAMEESMMEIIPQLEKRTPYVALLSNIATLLGLLGTIMGLIEAFTAVANANPAEKADLLSASISVAMNTTAFGLMSAIPLLLFHSKLTSTTGQIVDSLEMASVKALNSLSDFNRRHFDTKSGIPAKSEVDKPEEPEVPGPVHTEEPGPMAEPETAELAQGDHADLPPIRTD